jgi:2,5-furandicarboxylate decarboxylase 1
MFDDLREFMEVLEKAGELVKVTKEVDLKYEVGAVVRRLCDINGPAVLFEKVKGSRIPILSNLFGKYERVAMVFGVPKEKLHNMLCERTNSYPVPPIEDKNGPVKEIIIKGGDVDLSKLPIPTWNEKDGGPFITWGVQIAREPGKGFVNCAVHRMQVHSKNRLGIFANPPQHLGWFRAMAEEKGQPLDMAVVIGCDPALIIAAVSNAPYGWEELALAGAYRGMPIKTVRCETIDVPVPATAEIVLEGQILPNVREIEGNFGEVTGYYDPLKIPRPVFEVKAITHRKDPVYLGAYVGRPITDNHTAHTVGRSPFLLRELRQISPRVVDAYFPAETYSQYAVIKIRKSFMGGAREEPKRLAFVTFGHFYQVKECVIVDEDINIYDPSSVQWAIATRVRPELDIHVIPSCPGSVLEVAYESKERGLSSKFIIDATKKYEGFPQVAEPPREILERINLKDYIPGWK